MDDIRLTEVAEEEGFDVTNQMEITKYLKLRVSELINKANDMWDQRNAQAVEEGDAELPRLLPLVRLKVDTTGVPTMSNPIRFGQDFVGKIANPRDVLVFHRAKKSATRRVVADEPELAGLDGDEEGDGTDKLAAGRVRVHALVQEYLRAQEMQLLGEAGMSDAIQVFVEKDDIHAISKHVDSTVRAAIKGVQASGEVLEENLDDAIQRVREERERQYTEQRTGKTGGAKGKAKGRAEADDDDAGSVDSMAMDIDEPGSDFGLDIGPPSAKKAGKSRGKRATTSTATGKKASSSGRKRMAESDDEDDEEIDEVPKSTTRTGRAAAPSNQKTGKRASAANKSPAKAKQTTLSFAPSGATSGRTSTRAAAGRARGKMAVIADVDSD